MERNTRRALRSAIPGSLRSPPAVAPGASGTDSRGLLRWRWEAMSDSQEGRPDRGAAQRGPRRPSPRKKGGGHPRGGGRGPRPGRGAAARGSIRLAAIGGENFELVHPRCVAETELDYEEGLEIWKAGDPEGARDALRYALAACRDNLWIHTALGKLAIEEFRDPSLAQGHFGYAVELAERAIPPQFGGRLPPERAANQPFYDALDGLIGALEALGKRTDAARLREWRERLGRPAK